MKIGVISHGSPDYLIDIVTDGLIRLLGRDKISLDYNVRGGWGGGYAHLLQGFHGPEPFDIHEADVLIASTRSIPAVKAWAKKTGRRRPVAFLDGEDGDQVGSNLFSDCAVYFKREYYKGRSYPSNVKPLPFAAIPELLIDGIEVTRKVFYSGHVTHHFRKEIENVLSEMGHHAAPSQDKSAYNKCLMSSLVGVAIRGNGWDTYRYWEIPYFGAMLFSERAWIVIPNEFEDGKEAVYYDNASDFRTKLRNLLETPEKTLEIARAGHEASIKRHLSINRAKTVLEALS